MTPKNTQFLYDLIVEQTMENRIWRLITPVKGDAARFEKLKGITLKDVGKTRCYDNKADWDNAFDMVKTEMGRKWTKTYAQKLYLTVIARMQNIYKGGEPEDDFGFDD